MAGNIAAAPAGTGVASFKVPRPWESNVPKFTTEDKDDLRDFIEQVNDIIELAQITDDDEQKRLLTSYLPVRKRETWRGLPEYATGVSYTDFKKAVLKVYPEVQEDLDGTLEELEELSINTRNLIKADLLVNNPPPAGQNAVDHRKEDPILLDELIKMAERLASSGGAEATWGDEDAPEIKRSDRFPAIKIERKDARLEELGGELSSLRDALAVSQKQAKAAHDELLRAMVNVKGHAPSREENEHRDGTMRVGASNSYGSDGQWRRGYGQSNGQTQRNGCYYCDGQDHFSKECTMKAAHIQKGWIAVEDGQQRLADGNFIPRGKGPPALRVEEYWQRKGMAGQHMYAETLYGGALEDEFDVLRDEVRTLRVKLNQVSSSEQRTPPAAPTTTVSNQSQSYANHAAPVPMVNMEELGRTVFNAMRMGNPTEQYLQTRSGARTVSFASPPEQDF
ncbi:hypothetical protein FB451DRAFT_1411702 [Mycena latifolia]|nr:hypothetical protein FB451DRAFT_1411702 [Mycena latifolia]